MTTTLFDLVTGDEARIVRICGGGPQGIRQRLLDMGVRMLADGSDWGILVNGFRNLRGKYGEMGFRFRDERSS